MKVCLVASNSVALIGGFRTFFRHIVEANQTLGNEVSLVNPGPFCSSFYGARVINVQDEMQGPTDLIFFISRSYRQAQRIAVSLGPLAPPLMTTYFNNFVARITTVLSRIEGIDIFHSISPYAAYALRQAGQKYLALCVNMEHITFAHTFKSRRIPELFTKRTIRALRNFEVEGYSGATLITANGLDLLEYLREDLNIPEVELFMSPVEIDEFAKISREEAYKTLNLGCGAPVIAFVGHLDSAKGLDILINAVHALDKRGIKTRLIVAGDGLLRSKFEGMTGHLDINARFFGYRKDVGIFYKAEDIVALPFKETLGGTSHVLLEALACGTPVVTNKILGRQAIPYEEQLVYAESENPRSYADKIEQILDSAELQAQLRQNAISYINKYHTRDKFVSQVGRLYSSFQNKRRYGETS